SFKLATDGKNQGDSRKIEDDKMPEDEEDESSGEEVVTPQKKGKKATTTPAKKMMASPTKSLQLPHWQRKQSSPLATPAKKTVTPAKSVVMPGKKGATPGKATAGKKGEAVPAKGAKNGKNAKREDSDEEDEDDSEEENKDDEEEDEPAPRKAAAFGAAPATDDEDEEEDEGDSEEEPMEIVSAKEKKAPAKAVPVKAKSTAEDENEEDEEEEEEEDDNDDEEEDGEEEEEEEEEEEPKQKVEGTKPATSFNLFVGNLNFNKSSLELKTGISDIFAKNDLAVVDVRIGVSRKFGYVDFKSAEDLLKVFGDKIKLGKPKGKDSKKDRDARTLLDKNLPCKVTQDDLKEVFEDAVEIRLVSKDGKSKGIACIEFKTEADEEKNLGGKMGDPFSLSYTREKGQSQDHRDGKNHIWSGESKTLVLSNLFYSAMEETLQEVFERATHIKMLQNQNSKSKGYAFIEFASFEDIKEALNSCNKREIEGRAIRLEFHPPKTVYVSHLMALSERLDPSKGLMAKAAKETIEDGEIDRSKVTLDWAKPKGEDGFRGRGGGRSGRGRVGDRGQGGGFQGGRGGGGDHRPQGEKMKFE
uniref:Nucleolin n=1 Tax=Capra hircus TaxID=9925 RepID=A0A452EDB9_CAPHI